MNFSIAIERGRISTDVDVPDLIIRLVNKHHLVPELDGFDMPPDDAEVQTEIKTELRLQGHVVNRSKKRLSDIKYDVSYYDSQGHFLGLDASRLIDEDSLDLDDYLPLDMRVSLPEHTEKCVFNLRTKKAGLLDKFLGS